MGLFGSIGSFLGTAAKAVATGGISLIAPKLIPAPINTALNTITTLQNPTNLSQLVNTISVASLPVSGGAVGLGARTLTSTGLPASIGGSSMALNIGGLLGQVGGILGNSNIGGNALVSGLSQGLQLAGSVIPVANRTPAVMSAPTASAPLAIAAGTRGLTQEIFNAGAKVLNRLGVPYRATTGGFSSALKRSLSTIASLARRTPAGTMVGLLTGLGLTAMEAYVLTSWQAQRRKQRRMNPANSKALRRSVRRIKMFHKLCGDADVIKPRKRCAPPGRFAKCA